MEQHKLDESNSYIKEDINIDGWFLYSTEKHKEYYQKFVVPAKSQRDWMDDPAIKKNIYHCTPVVSANTLGWWILNSQDLEVEWDGGWEIDSTIIKDYTEEETYNLVRPHFGSGLLTFSIPILFQTPPGWGLWVGGPSNIFIDGLHPLEGIVETNWSPFTFTMNYKITRKNHVIEIPKYHPICRIVPIPLNLNEKTKLNFKFLKDNEELHKRQVEWHDARTENLKEYSETLENKRMFHYRDGVDVKGCPFKGFHKMFYKYDEPKIEQEKNDSSK